MLTAGELRFRVMTASDAAMANSWLAEPRPLSDLLDRENAYYGILDGQDKLVGYCCFGRCARVEGGDYQAQAIDVAAGWPPGIADGPDMPRVVLGVALFSRALFNVAPLRTTVLVAQRLIRAWEAAGFLPLQRFIAADGADYLQLALPPSDF